MKSFSPFIWEEQDGGGGGGTISESTLVFSTKLPALTIISVFANSIYATQSGDIFSLPNPLDNNIQILLDGHVLDNTLDLTRISNTQLSFTGPIHKKAILKVRLYGL